MEVKFLEWYNHAYCLEEFETIALYEQHKRTAYSGWFAAMRLYDV